MDEIDRVDSSEKNAENADISYTTYGDYYLDGNYTLWVNMGQKTPKITYQLIVLLPQNVGIDKNSTDWYVQANTLLDFVYSMRYTALVVMFFSFIIGVAAFVFLMCAAGQIRLLRPSGITCGLMFLQYLLCWQRYLYFTWHLCFWQI